jgi:hypothetical protein
VERAAVLIGVRKTGNLDLLPAARPAAQAMARWAQAQAIPPDRIKIILDDDAPVTIERIYTAIEELAATFVVQQLLIYFCGHGIYTRGSEYWLLSRAPGKREEAVNLAASADAARQSVFPHVIFISDACRTAAVGFQYQQITGSSIFLNPETLPEEERSVDQFFACALNTASNQTRDPANPQAPFQSIFTNTLIEALNGRFQQAVCPGNADDHSARRRVHPWPLKTLLKAEVPQAIRKAGLPLTAYQTPDARICSEPTAWIADLAPVPEQPPSTPSGLSGLSDLVKSLAGLGLASTLSSLTSGSGLLGGGLGDSIGHLVGGSRKHHPPKAASPPPPLETPPMDTVLAMTLDRSVFEPFKQVEGLPDGMLSDLDATVRRQASRLVQADRPTQSHFESGMGFRIHNAILTEALPLSSTIREIDQGPDAAVVWSDTPSANVLLIFSDGRGTVLPAIAGFITSLTFDETAGEAELISVSYEPMDPDTRVDEHVNPESAAMWQDMKIMAETARENRALIASLTRSGIFRLDTGTAENAVNAELLAMRLQSTKTYDPSMAIYAAYAYYDLQRTDLIQLMASFFVRERQIMLFDLALLTRTLTREQGVPPAVPVLPFFPMLSRGWSLMATAAIRPPEGLEDLERHVTDSLWTLFDPQGAARIRDNIASLETHYEGIGFRPREIAARTQSR